MFGSLAEFFFFFFFFTGLRRSSDWRLYAKAARAVQQGAERERGAQVRLRDSNETNWHR